MNRQPFGVTAGIGAMVLGLWAFGASGQQAPGRGAVQPADPSSTVVLNAHSNWRAHLTFMPEATVDKSGEITIRLQETPRGVRGQVAAFATEPPPASWAQPDFDDAGWPRCPGPFMLAAAASNAGYPYLWRVGLLCVRGRFTLSEPAKANLSLSMDYRGGAIVYVNGVEVARGHLPAGAEGGHGAVAPDVLADAYPLDAYLDAAGKPLRESYSPDGRTRVAGRLRQLADVQIPTAVLRNGVNVLAIELHRAPTLDGFVGAYASWSQLGLESLRLTGRGGAAQSNVRRPAGVRLFNANVLLDLHDLDYGEPHEPLRPVEIVAARNGAFSGAVALGSDQAIEKPQASISDFCGPGGATIPAAAVEIRYGLAGVNAHRLAGRHYDPPADSYGRAWLRRLDALSPTAPAQVAQAANGRGATLPIWITVKVPARAAPGLYEGTLTVGVAAAKRPDLPGGSASATALSVPVKLDVVDFTLPDPARFASFVGLVQSPDTVAARYNVPPWSERHWELLERSFQLLGQVGNDCLVIPLVEKSHYGNAESMVRWVRQADGGLACDLSIADKYLDLAIRHMGRPEVIALCVWEPVDAYSNAGQEGKGLKLNYTVVDPRSNKNESVPLPEWGTPQAVAFWKEAFAAVRKLVESKGLAAEAMAFGAAAQAHPGKAVCEELAQAAPWMRWYAVAHPYVPKVNGQETAISIMVYGQPGDLAQVPLKRAYGWKHPHLNAFFPRGNVHITDEAAAPQYHAFVETLLCWGVHGPGHVGADFWPILQDRYRITRENWQQLSLGGRGFGAILAAGPDGAIATARFEAFRDGLQQAEARILIEKALTDDGLRTKLGEELARRAQAELDARVQVLRTMTGTPITEPFLWYAGSADIRTRRLYTIAGQVAAALSAN